MRPNTFGCLIELHNTLYFFSVGSFKGRKTPLDFGNTKTWMTNKPAAVKSIDNNIAFRFREPHIWEKSDSIFK